MTTLKETLKKLTKLYSDLNDCNDGFTCNMIINDIELTLKSYGREYSKASLEKASENVELDGCMDSVFVNKKSITNPENIVLL